METSQTIRRRLVWISAVRPLTVRPLTVRQSTVRLSTVRLLLVCVLLTLSSVESVQAQNAAAKKGPGRDEVLTTGDGVQLHATYFESTAGKESPVAILLPSAEGPDVKDARNRRVWEKTAIDLNKSGYAVLSLDLRNHGDSAPSGDAAATAAKAGRDDYILMAAVDLEVVKDFLLKEHQNEKLNIRKLGIVSAGSSSMVAAVFAVADWAKPPYPDAAVEALKTPRGMDVRALMMLSPKASVARLNTTAALRTIKALPIAVSILASSKDAEASRDAERIFKMVELKGDEYKDVRSLTLPAIEARAERFLEGKEAEVTNKMIVDFLNKNVKELDAPWKTRTSRLQ